MHSTLFALGILAAAAAPAAPSDLVTITSPQGAKVAWTLPGTLLMPNAKTQACVIFFAGSGPTDRDWRSPMIPGSVGSAKLIADALHAKGVGSLRFDKIGSGANMKPLEVLSVPHYVDEAVAAYELMAAKQECQKVFFLGHSEGSLHALGAAVAKQGDHKFGGYISMSGPSRSLLDTAISQIHAAHAKAGDDLSIVDADLKTFREAIVKGNEESPDLSAIPEAQTLWFAAHDPKQSAVVRSLLVADPLASAKKYTGRALVLNAANDIQVPQSDAKALFEAIASKPDAKKHAEIAAANHVYRKEPKANLAGAEAVQGYCAADRPLADGVVDAITAFVTAK